MIAAPIALGLLVLTPESWRDDWAWGLPLIVLTVVIHVLGLGLMNERASQIFRRTERRHPTVVFALVMGTVTLLATSLHAMESGIWAICYQFLGALPGLSICDALFPRGDDNLRERRRGSGKPLETDGNDRGTERMAALWTDRCFLIWHDSQSGIAVHAPRTGSLTQRLGCGPDSRALSQQWPSWLPAVGLLHQWRVYTQRNTYRCSRRM